MEIESCCNFENSCIHIEFVNLSDGLYELVPSSEHTPKGSLLNLTELNQEPDQSSEESKASSAQEGKPRCI